MSDISFESLNGIVALMVLLALAASSAVTGIVFFGVSRAPARHAEHRKGDHLAGERC